MKSMLFYRQEHIPRKHTWFIDTLREIFFLVTERCTCNTNVQQPSTSAQIYSIHNIWSCLQCLLYLVKKEIWYWTEFVWVLNWELARVRKRKTRITDILRCNYTECSYFTFLYFLKKYLNKEERRCCTYTI